MSIQPVGLAHDIGCRCRRCLTEAYTSAKVRVTETTRRYHDIRTTSARPDVISQARQQWTEARQELILAEHDLRTAEDEAHIQARENRRTDALRWRPGEAVRGGTS